MKKILIRTALCILVLVTASVSAFVGISFKYENLFSKEETTTEATTAVTTEITTSRKETPPQSTEPETTQEPVIEFEDFSIIDIFPLSLTSGSWDVRHCQGIAVDSKNGYIYYSYTNLFVKCDFNGNVIGTITNIRGHLGDICYNEADGKIYGSYNPPGKKALYIAIIDPSELDDLNLNAVKSGLIRTVHLKDVWNDFSATVTVGENTYSRRYGVSGTDGVCFGPSFESGEGNYLTVACGITPQPARPDNDHQILLQYNVETWWRIYSEPLTYKEYHQSGPACDGKYFLFTGNTNYGVQTMTYFDELNVWLLNVYPPTKNGYNKYTLYVIDGDIKPYKALLSGQPEDDEQLMLTLYSDGVYDKNHGTYGWYSEKGNLGMEYMGGGLFYIIHPYETWYETQTAVAYLYVWDPSEKSPFTLAAGISTDYTISKKKTQINTN